jgi:hypothetical protein
LLLHRFLFRWLGWRCITGPGASSIGVGAGDAVAGAMSTMIVGIVTPGDGCWAYQAMPSAISAACTTRMESAEVPQRRIPVSGVSCRTKAFMAISFARQGQPVRS